MSGGRLSPRGIDHLRGELSDRDRAILKSVSELRLMSALQIEALHFTELDHRSSLAAARACRRALERLVRDQMLQCPTTGPSGIILLPVLPNSRRTTCVGERRSSEAL